MHVQEDMLTENKADGCHVQESLRVIRASSPPTTPHDFALIMFL